MDLAEVKSGQLFSIGENMHAGYILTHAEPFPLSGDCRAGLLLVCSVVLAQSGGGYDLSWSTVAAGGGTSSAGGVYSLGGTIGQSAPGLMSGGLYSVGGGFWGAAAVTAPENVIYLPLALRSY